MNGIAVRTKREEASTIVHTVDYASIFLASSKANVCGCAILGRNFWDVSYMQSQVAENLPALITRSEEKEAQKSMNPRVAPMS